MFFLRTFQLGIKSLLLHPLRSLLTVLGISIGVWSVITLLSIGEGISVEMQRQIEGLGADNIIVRSIKPPAEATAGFTGPVPYGLTRADFDILKANIPTLRENGALPIREVRRTFSFDGRDVDGRLVGCTPDYFSVTRLELSRGRLLTEADDKGIKNFCVLASGIAEQLFPYQDPLGRRIYLSESKDYYEVVGVLKYRTPTAAIGGSLEAQDFGADVYIPINTIRKQVGDLVVTRRGSQFSADIVELNQITLRVKSVELVHSTADLVRTTLNIPDEKKGKDVVDPKTAAPNINTASLETNRLAKAPRKDVAVVVPEELLEQARVARLTLAVFMGLIAAVSLLVGGIGIMNILLVSVTERTREIGVRMAVGAKRRHILMQFLIEAMTLSVVGGTLGIVVGVVGARLTTVIAGWPTIISGDTVIAAFVFSLAVGLFFGLYPANKAARLNPIDALRYE